MRISHSRIRTWRKCAKAHDYKHNQRLKRKAPAAPLLRGRIIGESLDAITGGKYYQTVLADYAKRFKKLFREEQEMYGDLIGDSEKILAGYVRYWKDDGLKYVGTEVKVEIRLTDDIVFVGYIDKVVEDAQGRVWIMDHKSNRVIPDEDQRAADQQLVFYGWAYRARETQGVVWDYLRTKPPAIPELLKNGQLSRRANIDTDQFTYRKAVTDAGLEMEDYEEFIGTLDDGRSFFRRVWLPHPPQVMVDTIVEDMVRDAKVIARLGADLTSRNLTRDCPGCEFFQLCQAELRGHNSETIRRQKYDVKPESEAQ